MISVVIPPVLKNNPSNLSQAVFRIRNPRETYYYIDFSESVSSGIRCIL